MKLYYANHEFDVLGDSGEVRVLAFQVFAAFEIEFLPMPTSGVKDWNDFYTEVK